MGALFHTGDSILSQMADIFSLTGTIMIVTNGSLEFFKTLSINKGDLYMIGAAFAMAIYLIMLKDIVKSIEPLKLTTYVFLITVILLIPRTLYEISKKLLIMTTPKGWESMFYMSIFASIISYFLQQISIKKVGPIETSLYMNLVSFFTVILAYLILGEKFLCRKLFQVL